MGHVQQLSKTFYGKKNNRVPYFETLTAILKTILLEIEKSSLLTKHMPNKCGVVRMRLVDLYWPVAQMVERLTVNQMVVGSTPSTRTNIRIVNIGERRESESWGGL